MAKQKEPESFEVTEYEGLDGDNDDTAFVTSVISQVVEEKVKEDPTIGCRLHFCDGGVRFTVHSYEMHLPRRVKEVEERAHKFLDEMLKYVKKEIKGRAGRSIDFKEDKDKRGHSVEKVSLNERYYYITWRFYEIS